MSVKVKKSLKSQVVKLSKEEIESLKKMVKSGEVNAKEQTPVMAYHR